MKIFRFIFAFPVYVIGGIILVPFCLLFWGLDGLDKLEAWAGYISDFIDD